VAPAGGGRLSAAGAFVLNACFVAALLALSQLSLLQQRPTVRASLVFAALFVFPAFVSLRLVGARIYGTALLKAVQTGAVPQDALGETEWQTLHRLELLQVQPPRVLHPVLRIVTWAGTRAGRITFGFLTGLIWFVFIVELYIAQFFNYRGAQVWLNQPLVHLPWFHHMPAALKNPWGDFLAAAAIVFVAWRLKRLVNWLKSLYVFSGERPSSGAATAESRGCLE